MSVTSYRQTCHTGYLGTVPTKRLHQHMIVDDRVVTIHDVTVHRFTMSDLEDPDLYAAEPLLEWQHSEQGAWVMQHAVESPVWHRMVDMATMGHTYIIQAKLKDKDYTFYQLKWS